MKKLTTCLVFVSLLLLGSLPALAQQTGSVSGTVTDADGGALPGVTVTASSNVLPQPRVAVTDARGRFRFPTLPPGNYEVECVLEGFNTTVRQAKVLLGQTTVVDCTMQLEGIEETLEVVGAAPLIDTSSAELKAAIDDAVIAALPIGQQYQDLVKLIPGVQYTEDEIRGPSAGGSGQDNVYLFDGVNVGTPLFGTLNAEPSSHDIDQIAVVKGGANAVDFNRSGGFLINSVSKSGTNAYHGMLSYQLQTAGMTDQLKTGSSEEFDEDRDWTVANLGGPLWKDNLFFYASYYRPTRSKNNASNAYGAVPDFEDVRDELFGKLTFTPTDSFLLNASYRDSDREQTGRGVSEFETASRSVGDDAIWEIAIAEGSWVLNNQSFLSFKYTDFTNLGSSRPDTIFDFPITVGPGGTVLDVNNLDQQGELAVPTPADCGGDPVCLAFIPPIINRYGYLENGVPTGGGFVGVDDSIDQNDFFRESFQISYDYLFGSAVTHELHVGYQWYEDAEELNRTSNGWGEIEVIGSRPSDGPAGTFYQAVLQQAGTVGFPAGTIRSAYESQSIGVNDVISWNNWTFNVGVLVSNDELFGQGLRENPGNVSGFELAPGNKYKMYEIDWSDMIQPRLGAVWAYNGEDTVYANYARYNPAASSLPRAASWARNTRNQVLDVFFDAAGNQIGSQQRGGSSGKFFQEGMDPRAVSEYLVGTARQLSSRWTARAHARYRYASNFWEDTNNNARSRLLAPEGYPQEDYIPELGDYRGEVGGSSYVIAQLDFAANKYWEANLEAEYRSSKAYFKGTYVWSHYYGNFDQDNSSSTNNDFNTFIGSSFIADFAGRQVWNDHYGNLRGDRRHQLKLYGFYNFDWNGSVGVYAIYQSGQPWEVLNADYYRCLDPVAIDRNDPACRVGGTGSSNNSYRFGSCLDPASGGPGTGVCPYPRREPAGNKTTDDHYQIDLNYTQNFRFGGDRFNVQLRADVFNVFDKQTGYHINAEEKDAGFGEPRDFFDPRRLQLAVRFEF